MKNPTRRGFRVIATLLLLAMVISALPVSVFAANGYSVIRTTTSRLYSSATGNGFPFYSVTKAPAGSPLSVGDIVFCIDRNTDHAAPDDDTSLDDNYYLQNDSYWHGLSWYAKRGVTFVTLYADTSTDMGRAAAQTLLWEFTLFTINPDTLTEDFKGALFQRWCNGSGAAEYTTAYETLIRKIANHTKAPSSSASS